MFHTNVAALKRSFEWHRLVSCYSQFSCAETCNIMKYLKNFVSNESLHVRTDSVFSRALDYYLSHSLVLRSFSRETRRIIFANRNSLSSNKGRIKGPLQFILEPNLPSNISVASDFRVFLYCPNSWRSTHRNRTNTNNRFFTGWCQQFMETRHVRRRSQRSKHIRICWRTSLTRKHWIVETDCIEFRLQCIRHRYQRALRWIWAFEKGIS